jgi:hypothetical protein
MRRPVACAFLNRWGDLLLRGRRLSGGGGLDAGEDGAVGAGAREEDGEADGAEHEDDGGVGGQLGEEVSCAARAEGCLRTLAAEGSGEVGGFALLEEDDANDEERDDDVKRDEKTDQHSACNLLDVRERNRRKNVRIRAEDGTEFLCLAAPASQRI